MNVKVVFSILLLGALIAASSLADDREVSEANDHIYKGQRSFLCNGKTIRIPSYFAYTNTITENLYLECDKDKDAIYLGLSAGCRGQNMCGFGSYWSEEVSSDVAEKVESAFITLAKEVELKNGVSAYYVPSKCYAYCNEAKLIWFDHSRMHIIGTTYANGAEEDIMDELRKSAASLYKK